MKKIRLFLIALAALSFAALYSCKQAPKEGEEGSGQPMEAVDDTMDQSEEMIEEAEELESDTAFGEEEME